MNKGLKQRFAMGFGWLVSSAGSLMNKGLKQ